jgi:hypothetical protein
MVKENTAGKPGRSRSYRNHLTITQNASNWDISVISETQARQQACHDVTGARMFFLAV